MIIYIIIGLKCVFWINGFVIIHRCGFEHGFEPHPAPPHHTRSWGEGWEHWVLRQRHWWGQPGVSAEYWEMGGAIAHAVNTVRGVNRANAGGGEITEE